VESFKTFSTGSSDFTVRYITITNMPGCYNLIENKALKNAVSGRIREIILPKIISY
jgi:hypothetical protein